jgi:hypothetical protein
MTGNGYTEISILGRVAGLKFNMYAVERFEEIKGTSGTVRNFTAVIWAGLLGNCFAKQIEPEFTFEQVCDFVEELILSGDPGEILSRVMEVFNTSHVMQKLIDRANRNGEPADELKKKIAAV